VNKSNLSATLIELFVMNGREKRRDGTSNKVADIHSLDIKNFTFDGYIEGIAEGWVTAGLSPAWAEVF